MDSVAVYCVASLAWLGLQAVPLVVAPSFVVSLLATDLRIDDVAVYFARALGLAQLALGLLVVLLSGLLPLGSAADSRAAAHVSPFATATVVLSTLYHAATAFYSYACYYAPGYPSVGTYGVGCVGSTTLAALGLWCLLFAGPANSGHLSRRTGVDKRTSNFPFANAAAYKREL